MAKQESLNRKCTSHLIRPSQHHTATSTGITRNTHPLPTSASGPSRKSGLASVARIASLPISELGKSSQQSTSASRDPTALQKTVRGINEDSSQALRAVGENIPKHKLIQAVHNIQAREERFSRPAPMKPQIHAIPQVRVEDLITIYCWNSVSPTTNRFHISE